MSSKRYPEEFKIEAVKQVVDRGHSVSSVCNTPRYHYPQSLCLDKEVRTGLFHQQRAVRCSGRDPSTPEGAEAGY